MEPKAAAVETREVLSKHDPHRPAATADALRSLWQSAVPGPAPELEPGQKKLIRDWGIADPHFEAAGTPVPVLTAIGEEIGRLGRSRADEILPLALLLWERYGREGRIVAVVGLGPMELADPEAVVATLYEMARGCQFWEDCDQLAMKALEPILRREPAAWLERIGAWIPDESKWVRRAGLTAVGRLPMKRPDLTARCVELLQPALGDPDTDVKRALSFALRVCARGDVEPVKQFIRTHQGVSDAASLWVFSDVVRSLWRTLVPQFRDLLPVYRGWLETAPLKAKRGVESAISLLESS